MPSLARSERDGLADVLADAGEDAPTLCAGWTTRDLAAHVVLRERRPDAALGIVVPPVRPWTRRVQAGYARRPYDELVALVRAGPPRLSPFAIAAVDRAANTYEMFVHHEDVRRARATWEPRLLPSSTQDRLWRPLAGAARSLMRRTPCPVVLERPGGGSVMVPAGGSSGSKSVVTVMGEPAELVLFAYGRQAHARVETAGDEELVARVREARFGV